MNLDQAVHLVFTKLDNWIRAFILALPNLLSAVVVLILFWLIARLARATVSKTLSRLTRNSAVSNFIATLTYVAVVIAGVFVSLGVLSLDKTVMSLLAGAGIVGLGLAFAFRESAENLISGIILSVRHPFRIGDLIKTNDYMGIVRDLSLRATSIQTPEGQIVSLPNRSVLQNPLVNYTESKQRRVDISVGVSYKEDLERVKTVALRGISELPGRDKTQDPELFFTEFSESSITFVLRIWIKGTSQTEYMAARSEAIMCIKAAFDQAGITIPFPVRVIELDQRQTERLSELFSNSTAGAARRV